VRESLDILQRSYHSVAVLLGRLRRNQGDFELSPDYGKRRTQLMRNVRRELPDLFKREAQPRHHAIESLDKPVELVAGPTDRNMQVEAGVRDALGRGGYGVDGRESATRQKPTQQPAQRDDYRHDTKIL